MTDFPKANKKRIALHLIMPKQVSGPNTSNRLIRASWLAKQYHFEFFSQTWHAGARFNFGLVRDLARQLRRIRPDLIHISGLQGSGFHAVVAARFATRAKILVTIRGFAGDDMRIGRIKRTTFNVILEPLTLLLCSRFYVVCSDAGRKPVVRLFRRKYAGVIFNAAPSIDFDVKQTRAEMRRTLGFSASDFVAAVVGRMVPDKGIAYIAEAALSRELSGVRWLFVGDGPMYDEFQERWPELIQDGRVTLVGRVEDAKPLLAAADLFVFGTLHENLSNALLEAMSIGLPVVATAVGGNVEVVDDGRNGILIDPANVAAIIAGVKRVKDLREEDWCSWSEASKSIVATRFSQTVLLSRLNELYEELV